MTEADAKKRIAHLRSELVRHNFLYYVEARPEISDREYHEDPEDGDHNHDLNQSESAPVSVFVLWAHRPAYLSFMWRIRLTGGGGTIKDNPCDVGGTPSME